jgi:sulfide:quinone oxidoreductase
MRPKVVVLGGGTGGTLLANRLVRARDAAVQVTVVDRDGDHLYQPGLLFVPFGLAKPDDLVRPRRDQLLPQVHYRQSEIDHVDLHARRVHLADGTHHAYDVLVVATGARLAPEETEGLTGPGWGDNVFTFYDLPGARSLAGALERFRAGRLVVNVVDMPVKCPVAPLEFCFLADWYFQRRGLREQVRISYVTPLDGAFTKPVCSQELGGLLGDKGIDLVTEFNTGTVDGERGALVAYDGREQPFDLAVVVPLHVGADYVGRSPGLGDELNFVPVDPHTLQSKASPNVFAIGDATDVPTSKAGSVAHFEGEVLADNVTHYLADEPLRSDFDGHTNCFIESGFGKALLVDFNYDTEPLPGHFPGPVGVPLMRESRACHLGKLAFSWLYWHVLLPGHSIPGVSTAMPTAGKRFFPDHDRQRS